MTKKTKIGRFTVVYDKRRQCKNPNYRGYITVHNRKDGSESHYMEAHGKGRAFGIPVKARNKTEARKIMAQLFPVEPHLTSQHKKGWDPIGRPVKIFVHRQNPRKARKARKARKSNPPLSTAEAAALKRVLRRHGY